MMHGHEQEANMRQRLTTIYSKDHNRLDMENAGAARDRPLAEVLCQRRKSVDLLTKGATMQRLHRGLFYNHNFLKEVHMKKILSSMAIIGYTILNVAAANAVDGTINFQGELLNTSCVIKVNGQGSPATVTLPTVGVSALSTVGQTAGDTNFDITVSDCDGSYDVVTEFTGSNIDVSSGRLINTAVSGAAGVQLEVLDRATGLPIKLGPGSELDATPVTTDASGNATLPYTVRYYAAGSSVTAGLVTSSVEFTIVYP